MRRVGRCPGGLVLALAMMTACSSGGSAVDTPTPFAPSPAGSATQTAGPPTGGAPSGVSATPAPRVSPTSDGLGQPWKFSTTEGARGSFEVPGKSNDVVQRVEKERRIGKGKELYYVSARIDNSAGTEDVQLETLEVVAADGKRLSSARPQDVIERWQQPTGNPSRLRLIKLQNDLEKTVKPGEQASVVKIFEAPIRSIARSFVYLDGDREVVEAHVG